MQYFYEILVIQNMCGDIKRNKNRDKASQNIRNRKRGI
jgi:hypothetical protein